MAEGTIPNELATILAISAQSIPKPLRPYTTVTHYGKSTALVLPDGDGNELVLLCNAGGARSQDMQPEPLKVHGIEHSRHGRKLTIKVIGGLPPEFHPASELAKPFNRVILKNANDVTKVGVGNSIEFTYDEKAPGWRQQ